MCAFLNNVYSCISITNSKELLLALHSVFHSNVLRSCPFCYSAAIDFLIDVFLAVRQWQWQWQRCSEILMLIFHVIEYILRLTRKF